MTLALSFALLGMLLIYGGYNNLSIRALLSGDNSQTAGRGIS